MNDRSANIRAHPAPLGGAWMSQGAPEIGLTTPEARGIERFIPAGEIIIARFKPSAWFLLLARLEALIGVSIVAGVGAIAAASEWIDAPVWRPLAVGCIALCAMIAWNCLDWLTRWYVLTDRRVMRISGVIRQSVGETTLNKVQSVTTYRGVRERLTGTGTLVIASAGEHIGAVVWFMTSDPATIAERLRQAVDRYGRMP